MSPHLSMTWNRLNLKTTPIYWKFWVQKQHNKLQLKVVRIFLMNKKLACSPKWWKTIPSWWFFWKNQCSIGKNWSSNELIHKYVVGPWNLIWFKIKWYSWEKHYKFHVSILLHRMCWLIIHELVWLPTTFKFFWYFFLWF